MKLWRCLALSAAAFGWILLTACGLGVALAFVPEFLGDVAKMSPLPVPSPGASAFANLLILGLPGLAAVGLGVGAWIVGGRRERFDEESRATQEAWSSETLKRRLDGIVRELAAVRPSTPDLRPGHREALELAPPVAWRWATFSAALDHGASPPAILPLEQPPSRPGLWRWAAVAIAVCGLLGLVLAGLNTLMILDIRAQVNGRPMSTIEAYIAGGWLASLFALGPWWLAAALAAHGGAEVRRRERLLKRGRRQSRALLADTLRWLRELAGGDTFGHDGLRVQAAHGLISAALPFVEPADRRTLAETAAGLGLRSLWLP